MPPSMDFWPFSCVFMASATSEFWISILESTQDCLYAKYNLSELISGISIFIFDHNSEFLHACFSFWNEVRTGSFTKANCHCLLLNINATINCLSHGYACTFIHRSVFWLNYRAAEDNDICIQGFNMNIKYRPHHWIWMHKLLFPQKVKA